MALDLATEEEINTIEKYAFQVNEIMKQYFGSLGIDLVDFKIEFGRYKGQVILADEVSPDTCRLWIKRPMKSWIRTVSEEIWERRGRL